MICYGNVYCNCLKSFCCLEDQYNACFSLSLRESFPLLLESYQLSIYSFTNFFYTLGDTEMCLLKYFRYSTASLYTIFSFLSNGGTSNFLSLVKKMDGWKPEEKECWQRNSQTFISSWNLKSFFLYECPLESRTDVFVFSNPCYIIKARSGVILLMGFLVFFVYTLVSDIFLCFLLDGITAESTPVLTMLISALCNHFDLQEVNHSAIYLLINSDILQEQA